MGGDVLLLSPPEDPLGAYLEGELGRRGLRPRRGTELFSDCRGLVLARLAPGDALAAALGGGGSQVGRLLFEALWAGTPAWVPREGLTWTQLPPTPLGRRVRESLEVLTASGLTVCPVGRLAERCAQGDGYAERLVTARRVDELGARGRRWLTLGRDALVTPLARDRAAELGLKLEREDGKWNWDG